LSGISNDNACYSSRLYLIKGALTKADIESLAGALSNTLIQRVTIKSHAEYQADGGMGAFVPKVVLDNKGTGADRVNLEDLSPQELEKLGKDGILNADGTRRGPLGLSALYLEAIRDYFKSEGRAPFDIEIETLAQTWSEHCKHTIFASPIDEIKDGLYKHYIKRATMEIREERGEDDICVSVFSDNAGGIIFDENYLITDKVETHNSPSALDPFGGAITGIVGVNRDCLGFGQGAKPVINRYGFCLADPRSRVEYYRDAQKMIPVLQPETIMRGVVAGVEAGGNQSGIPTPQGFVYFDDRFVGKPLVFVGTIGLIPREINGKPAHIKKARAGDHIVMLGGRVGRDGIHGATFSSVALDEGSPATAVQIGDPITQKKFSDAIIKELRDKGLYSAITDNGAGGLSSSVGEMAEQSGGFVVNLDKVPLKYPGMSPWEIWISESQERMTLAVPPENTKELIEFFAKRGCEATVIGTFTNNGRAQIKWHEDTIMDMAMDFLHDGIPETPLQTSFTRGGESEPDLPEPKDYAALLCEMLARPNICSKEFIGAQYDHNVQGSAVIGPFQGVGRVMGDASITKPVLTSPRGVVLSQGLFPRYSDIDTHAMSRAGLDMAVRSAVAAGADFFHLALLDNICWCSSDEPERLGQLKRAVHGIYHLARSYGTPFISGKDSMFNDFKGFDKDGKPIKISAPPTLLTSSIGVIPDVMQAISIVPKAVGDLVYILGKTQDECGASEYYDHVGHLGNNVPETRDEVNKLLYKCYTKVARKRLIASAMAVGYGGLGVTLAKKAIAAQLGMDIDLAKLSSELRADKILFSETTGRIVVTVAPQNVKTFEKTFDRVYLKHIGHISYSDKLNINNVLACDIHAMDKQYKATLKDY
jgi:phosphoribosylformylglycinamidine synthase